jgi:hypothetical protein
VSPAVFGLSEAAEKWVAAKSPTCKAHGWIEEATFWARVCRDVDVTWWWWLVRSGFDVHKLMLPAISWLG